MPSKGLQSIKELVWFGVGYAVCFTSNTISSGFAIADAVLEQRGRFYFDEEEMFFLRQSSRILDDLNISLAETIKLVQQLESKLHKEVESDRPVVH